MFSQASVIQSTPGDGSALGGGLRGGEVCVEGGLHGVDLHG